MGKGAFKRYLASKCKQEFDVVTPEAENPEKKDAHRSTDRHVADSPVDMQAQGIILYDDLTVCSYLGIKRRILNAVRTKNNRGKDWDCLGDHVGMTADWVQAYIREKKVQPNTNIQLKPIQANDGVVSVKVHTTHPNPEIVTVQKISDGTFLFAKVRNQQIPQFMMHLGECFDAVHSIGEKLEWSPSLNDPRRIRY